MSNPFRGSANSASANDGDYQIPEAGSVAGVLVAIVDLGTHNESFQGAEMKKVRKGLFVWELVTLPKSGTAFNFCLSKEYNLSTTGKYHPKSALRIAFEKWRGGPYKEDEEIDFTLALGKTCLVSVTHKEAKQSGNSYAVMSGISKLPKEMANTPPPKHKPFMFLIEEGAKLPTMEWLPSVFHNGELLTAAQKIERSDEWRALHGSRTDAKPSGNGNGAASNFDFSPPQDVEESVPF